MSKRVKFKLDINGLRQLMKSTEMKAVLTEAGQQVARNASGMSGEEWDSRVHDASFVSICNVYPATPEARAENYENNTAIKALSSSGLRMTK